MLVPLRLMAALLRCGRGDVDVGPERQVPRHPLRPAVPDPVWMFATPIIYPASIVPETGGGCWTKPLTGIIEGFRPPCSGGRSIGATRGRRPRSRWSAAGLFFAYAFRRMERQFADIV